jgi:glycosyltransferase involved in cell wall biosynthesis
MLIKAFAIVREQHPDWSLVIHGEGIEREKLESLCQTLHIERNVSLPGMSSNLPAEFNKASIFSMSSRFEGFPMVLIEAMASGLPCISFNCSGPDEIINDGVNGLLVNEGDIKQFAEKIIFLIENPEKRMELSKQAILKADKYTAPQVRTRWLEVLKDIHKFKNA